MKKDSYPIRHAEGPPKKLAGKEVFSKLDLRSAYWQFPVYPQSIEKQHWQCSTYQSSTLPNPIPLH